ncbi:MAG: DUF6295 family protein [Chloroflexi bacterium]|nr:DUF6295 family protein [Chloroflexota bacterium]
MCSWITHKTEIKGVGRGASGWFDVTQANVSFDHPSHAWDDHALLLDFVNEAMGPGARIAVEIDAKSAKALADAILKALEAGEAQHALA